MILKNCYCHAGIKLQTKSSFYSFFLKGLSFLALLFIGLYRSVFTAHFGAGVCRFEPSCSSYANQAFLEFPFFLACKLVLKRIIKCYPGSSFGADPLPRLIHPSHNSSEIVHESR